ncbi:MAG: hypothetical protein VB120_06530 [Lachnospiraceae bacterium]|nr:hypothetical protein [Lachnospiraceae bacterium]
MKMMKNRGFLALILLLAVFLSVSCQDNSKELVLNSDPVENLNNPTLEEPENKTEEDPGNSEQTQSEESTQEQNNDIEDPNSGNNEPDSVNPGNAESNSQGSTSGQTSSVVTSYDENWSALSAIAKSGQAYYTEYFSKTRLISKNGLLYNKAAERSIDVKYLCDNEGLSSQYKDEAVSVLLVYGSDLKAYSGVSVKKAEEGLTVFTAKKYGSESKYMISSASGRCGIILESEYNTLLYKYNQNHGSIKRLTKDNSEYERILTFVRMYEGKYESYSVRSIICDNKYAMVILSPNSNKADLRQYILRKTDNIWEVVMGDVEIEARLLVSINKSIPDYNIDMVPTYTIADYTIKTDFADINKVLFDNLLITNINQVIYTAGTSTHCYVELFRGNGYLFTRAEGEWQYKAVGSTKEAFNLLINQGNNKPIFILPDEY